MAIQTETGRADQPSGAVPSAVAPAPRPMPLPKTPGIGVARGVTGLLLLIFGGLSVVGLSVNLGALASQVVGWALLASALLFLTAYAFDR